MNGSQKFAKSHQKTTIFSFLDDKTYHTQRSHMKHKKERNSSSLVHKEVGFILTKSWRTIPLLEASVFHNVQVSVRSARHFFSIWYFTCYYTCHCESGRLHILLFLFILLIQFNYHFYYTNIRCAHTRNHVKYDIINLCTYKFKIYVM